MSLKEDHKRIENKLKYLSSVIEYDRRSIQDIKSDLKDSTFKTKCILFDQINQYRQDIEDTMSIIKKLTIYEEEQQLNQENNDDTIKDRNSIEENEDYSNLKSFKQFTGDSYNNAQTENNSIKNKESKSMKKASSSFIDFPTFLELYGLLIILNETKGIGVIEKGGHDLKPIMMDLIDTINGTPIAKNISTFEQLLEALQ